MGKINDISNRRAEPLDLAKKQEDKRANKNHVIDLHSDRKTSKNQSHFKDVKKEHDEVLTRPATKKSNLRYITILGLASIITLNLVNSYYKGVEYKNTLIDTVKSGYSSLLHAQNDFLGQNIPEAQKNLETALTNFKSASDSLELLKNQVSGYDQNITQRMIDGVFTSANIITESALGFSERMNKIREIVGMSFSSGKESITEMLDHEVQNILKLKDTIKVALGHIENIPQSLVPETYRERLKNAEEKIRMGIETIESSSQYWPAAMHLLGDRLPQRYMIIFQNSNEKRPTGGFIGSIGIVDINDGYITKMEVHDVYDFDGRIHEHIEPPEEIKALAGTWRMRDSNYSPDFRVSAAKMEWFLQKEYGPSADHVIAIDQSLIIDFLKEIGPIELSLLNKPLQADDLELILSYVVESKITGATTPKTILKELKNKLIEKIKDPQNLKKIAPIIVKALDEKRIQFWSKDEDIQNIIEKLNWGGEVIDQGLNEDYMNIVDISVGGNKSDKYVSRAITHTTFIESSGTITNNIEFTKKHTVTPEMKNQWHETVKGYGFDGISETVEQILGNAMQKSMQKIYVPRGSTLIRVEGIDPEKVILKTDLTLNKDYFYFPMNVAVGEEKSLSLTYTLPFTLNPKSYSQYVLNYQTQSANKAQFTKKIFIDSSINVHQVYPEQMNSDEPSLLIYETMAQKDFHVSVALGP